MPKLKLIFSTFSKTTDPEFDEHCEDIKKFITVQIHHGKPLSYLKKVLKEKGWSNSHINESIRRYKKDVREGMSSFELSQKEDLKEGINQVPNNETIVKISNISKSFGKNIVLDKVDFNIKKGDIVGIIGLSGSGKSTLLNILIGFYAPDEGIVAFRKGQSNRYAPILKNRDEVKNVFGYSPQDPSFYRRLTTWENLNHFGSLHKIPRSERKQLISKLLSDMGLTHAKNTLSGNLSGGMQRRLSIACAIIHSPNVLILDEPTADLDPFMRKGIWNLINEINKKGTTIILTSHFLSEVEGLCNRIAILHDRKIRAYGSADELKSNFTKDQEIIVDIQTNNYSRIIDSLKKAGLPLSKIISRDGKLVIYSSEAEKVIHSIIHSIEEGKDILKDIDLNKPSLSEIFESYILKKEVS
jgi:ABC-2 type transport system ATP-binding protein